MAILWPSFVDRKAFISHQNIFRLYNIVNMSVDNKKPLIKVHLENQQEFIDACVFKSQLFVYCRVFVVSLVKDLRYGQYQNAMKPDSGIISLHIRKNVIIKTTIESIVIVISVFEMFQKLFFFVIGKRGERRNKNLEAIL